MDNITILKIKAFGHGVNIGAKALARKFVYGYKYVTLDELYRFYNKCLAQFDDERGTLWEDTRRDMGKKMLIFKDHPTSARDAIKDRIITRIEAADFYIEFALIRSEYRRNNCLKESTIRRIYNKYGNEDRHSFEDFEKNLINIVERACR